MPSQTSVTAFLMAERGTKKGKTTLLLKIMTQSQISKFSFSSSSSSSKKKIQRYKHERVEIVELKELLVITRITTSRRFCHNLDKESYWWDVFFLLLLLPCRDCFSFLCFIWRRYSLCKVEHLWWSTDVALSVCIYTEPPTTALTALTNSWVSELLAFLDSSRL